MPMPASGKLLPRSDVSPAGGVAAAPVSVKQSPAGRIMQTPVSVPEVSRIGTAPVRYCVLYEPTGQTPAHAEPSAALRHQILLPVMKMYGPTAVANAGMVVPEPL